MRARGAGEARGLELLKGERASTTTATAEAATPPLGVGVFLLGWGDKGGAGASDCLVSSAPRGREWRRRGKEEAERRGERETREGEERGFRRKKKK